MLEDEEITTWKVWISTGKTRTSTGEREDQPEEENIGRRAETSTGKRKHRRRRRTSAGEQKHQPESRNIGRKAETSTGEQKHRPEIGNINRKMQNIGGWKGFSVIK